MKKAIFTTLTSIQIGTDYLPGVREAMELLWYSNFTPFVVTHMPWATEAEYYAAAKKLKTDIGVRQLIACLHKPEENCVCAPPAFYLIHRAIEVHRLDPEDTYAIADSAQNVSMFQAAYIRHVHFMVPHTSGFFDLVRARVLPTLRHSK